MKPLLALICAVAIGFVAYQYVYPPFGAYFGIDHPKVVEVPVEAPKVEVALEMPKVEMTRPEPKPEPPPEPKPEPKPMVAEAPPPPPPEPPKPKEGEFVPPVFRTIEEITQNWTVIPKSVFPREVKIAREMEVKSTIGATKIPAGGKAFALGQEGENLVLAPSPESKFRGALAIADTDIKDIINAVYENYKVAETARTKRLFELKKEEALRPKVASNTKGGGSASDDKPAKDKDGTYPLLLASMKAGEVTDVKPDNIKKWGEVTREKVEGQDVWIVTVTFEATTPFGKFEQDANAQVKNSKVLKWIYAGSGEVIP